MGLGICESCGVEADTKSVSLYKQTGMLVLRQTRTMKGHFCKKCISKYASKYTMHNLVAGWWGVISMIANPFYIANNVIQGLSTGSLREPDPEAGRPQLTDADIEILKPHVPAMQQQLMKGKSVAAVAIKFGNELQVKPAVVWVYLQRLLTIARQMK